MNSMKRVDKFQLQDKMQNVDDVFTFTKRLWNIAKKELSETGGYPGTLVIVDDKGAHALPVGALRMNTPEDIAAITRPWMKKSNIRGVGLVTEGVAVLAHSSEDRPEEAHALLVLCQWEDGMCSGLACELDVEFGSVGKVGSLTQEQVLRIARMPFAPSSIRVGES